MADGPVGSEKRGRGRFQYGQSIVVQGPPSFIQEAPNYTKTKVSTSHTESIAKEEDGQTFVSVLEKEYETKSSHRLGQENMGKSKTSVSF